MLVVCYYLANMKLTIKRSRKTGGTYRIYLPKHIGEEYEGDAECLANALTLTIIRPGVPLGRVKESLQIVLKDIELRIKQKADNEPLESPEGKRKSTKHQ